MPIRAETAVQRPYFVAAKGCKGRSAAKPQSRRSPHILVRSRKRKSPSGLTYGPNGDDRRGELLFNREVPGIVVFADKAEGVGGINILGVQMQKVGSRRKRSVQGADAL